MARAMRAARWAALPLVWLASCAEISAPEDEAAEENPMSGSADPSGGATSSGGSVGVIENGTGGGDRSMGGETAASGGMGEGATNGDGDDSTNPPSGMRCQDNTECEALPGCHECLLDAASFLFVCQAAPALLECGATCVDTDTSTEHCGVCDNACSSGASCVGGDCVCDGAAELCDGACINTQTDPLNCGACDETCVGETPYCISGACVACENAGDVSCGGTCTNRQTDANNCGACGTTCDTGSGEECIGGACGIGVCAGEVPFSQALHGGACSKQRAISGGHLWECGYWVNGPPPSAPNGAAAPCTSQEWCYVGPC